MVAARGVGLTAHRRLDGAADRAFRGFIPTRVAELVGRGSTGVAAGVVISAVLFAAIHVEQGAVGVGATFLDALFFSALRLKIDNLWAAVLAHGFNNTIGLAAFYLAGPIHGLW